MNLRRSSSRKMIAAASETRAVPTLPKFEAFGHQTFCHPQARRPSADKDREAKTRRQSAEYLDLSGAPAWGPVRRVGRRQSLSYLAKACFLQGLGWT